VRPINCYLEVERERRRKEGVKFLREEGGRRKEPGLSPGSLPEAEKEERKKRSRGCGYDHCAPIL